LISFFLLAHVAFRDGVFGHSFGAGKFGCMARIWVPASGRKGKRDMWNWVWVACEMRWMAIMSRIHAGIVEMIWGLRNGMKCMNLNLNLNLQSIGVFVSL
jgi:hypothetical protein